MRATTRERYRVYTQDEFFAEDGLLTADEPTVADEHGLMLKRRSAAGARVVLGAQRGWRC